LSHARRIFDTYKREAWTEHYANYNWFGRPRWTEPCAIIDSFLVAVSLWKHTRNPIYLEDAHHIFYNGIAHGQRDNGGFGTDECLGTAGPFLSVNCYEAYWCCTMRGGEGLARAIEFSYFTEGDSIYIPFYHPSVATIELPGGSFRIEQENRYPLNNEMVFRILAANHPGEISLHLFAPSWSAIPGMQVEINGQSVPAVVKSGFLEIRRHWKTGDCIRLHLKLEPRAVDLVNPVHGPEYFTFQQGPSLLACDCQQEIFVDRNTPLHQIGPEQYRLGSAGPTLFPICTVTKLATDGRKVQALFRSSDES